MTTETPFSSVRACFGLMAFIFLIAAAAFGVDFARGRLHPQLSAHKDLSIFNYLEDSGRQRILRSTATALTFCKEIKQRHSAGGTPIEQEPYLYWVIRFGGSFEEYRGNLASKYALLEKIEATNPSANKEGLEHTRKQHESDLEALWEARVCFEELMELWWREVLSNRGGQKPFPPVD